MYIFYVDFHEGAIRLTVKKKRSALFRWLTGEVTTTVIEAYMGRSGAIQLGRKLINQAGALGRVVRERDDGK